MKKTAWKLLQYLVRKTPEKPGKPFFRRLALEQLEERLALSVSFSFSGSYQLTSTTQVVLPQQNTDHSETDLAVNPVHPNDLAFTSNVSVNPSSGAFLPWESVGYSTNAGKSWTASLFGENQDTLGTDSQLDFRFNGAEAIDRFGNIHMVYLYANAFGGAAVVYGFSSDGGKTYKTQILSNDLAGLMGDDKPWVTVGPDAANPADDVVWVTYAHLDAAGNEAIYIRGASIRGLGKEGAFIPEVQVSTENSDVDYAIPSVSPSGGVAVTFQDNPNPSTPGLVQIYANYDPNGLSGIAFGQDVQVVTSNSGSDQFDNVTPNLGHYAIPWLAYDRSGGPNNGRLYLSYDDTPVLGSLNNTIMLTYSDDNGQTWSPPVQVSDTATNSRILPTISVDQSTGFVYLSWYDARNDPGNTGIQEFGTVSVDGGQSFLSNFLINPDMSFWYNSPGTSGDDWGEFQGISAWGGSAFTLSCDNSTSFLQQAVMNRMVLESTGGETLTCTGGAGNDTFYIRLDPSGTFIQIYENNPTLTGIPTFTATLAAVNNIVVDGGGGNNKLVVDMSHGSPIPAGGINYNGGTLPGKDILQVIGTPGNDTFVLKPGVLLVNNQSISYQNVTKIQANGGAGNDSFFSLSQSLPAPLTSVLFQGGDGNDLFSIAPSPTVSYVIDGGSPVRPTYPGDTLVLSINGAVLQTQNITNGGSNGYLTFKNRKPLVWVSIESGYGQPPPPGPARITQVL